MRITKYFNLKALLILALICAAALGQQESEKSPLIKILDSLPENAPFLIKKLASLLRSSLNNDDSTRSKIKEGFFCSSCKLLFDSLQNKQLTPVRFTIQEVMSMMCKHYWKQDPKVCDDAVKTNGKIFLDSLFQRYLDENLICPALKLCPETYERINVQKIIDEILKDKPKNLKSIKPKKEKISKVLHISDLHFDNKYAVNSNAFCKEPTCCRESSGVPANQTSKAGYWGIVGQCDLPFRTIEASVSFIKRNLTEQNIDFIIWTGDSTNHFIWDQSQQENINNTLQITELLQKELPNIPVLPVMGNHESYPCNVYDYESDREKNLNEAFANAWEYWIGKEAAEQYKKFGYYSTNQTKLGKKLRIIAINTQAGNPYNWFLIRNPTDPGHQLLWMKQELIKAELYGESVYIIGHIPSDETIDDWADIYTALIERFSNIIRGQFYGHTHHDQFKVYYDRNTTNINNVALITPSLTTYGTMIPSFRLFDIDRETFQPLNYKQYKINIAYYNQKNIQDIKQINYEVSYDFNKLYGFEDMTDFNSWKKLSDRIRTDLDTYQTYKHHFKAGVQSKSQFPQIDETVYCQLQATPRLRAKCNNKEYKRNFYEKTLGGWFGPTDEN